jgi:aspartyl-tRNA(Asn)/glutamyl-tRNA(Gln) amidotransferase subunit A
MPSPAPIAALLAACQSGTLTPEAHLHTCLSRANGNAGRNTYIALDPQWSLAEARRQAARAESALPLYGIPIALKDCFDLAGFPTSSGSRFYARHLPPAAADSWVAARLRHSGAVITGKTHLHQLAFGITGENRDYGDCLQPANSALLTGGSSSGSAAAIQEGSALAAIGTDTGGSVRAPAALCGLAGYRSSLGLGDWRGGYHLSESFDTIGWLFRDLRDAPLLAEALFDLPPEPESESSPVAPSIGILSGPLLEPCDAAVLRSLQFWLQQLRRASARIEPVQPDFWSEAWDIYAPIQAAEAARLHAGHFQEFEPVIAARLAWGDSLTDDHLRQFHLRRQSFCDQNDALFRRFDFLLAPITPLSRLPAGADHAETRAQILRLTTPASVAGLPAVVLPSPDSGLQLLAQRNHDRRLLRFAARLGHQLAAENAG